MEQPSSATFRAPLVAPTPSLIGLTSSRAALSDSVSVLSIRGPITGAPCLCSTEFTSLCSLCDLPLWSTAQTSLCCSVAVSDWRSACRRFTGARSLDQHPRKQSEASRAEGGAGPAHCVTLGWFLNLPDLQTHPVRNRYKNRPYPHRAVRDMMMAVMLLGTGDLLWLP